MGDLPPGEGETVPRDNTRLSGVVYSGDLLDLMSGDTILQRAVVNSQVVFDRPLPQVKTNLSKVRLVLADRAHNPAQQTPIRYGDRIHLKHNAMVNNVNLDMYIKYGFRLQSHQQGPLFRVYRIYHQRDPDQSSSPPLW